MSTKIYNGYIAKLSIPDLLFKFQTLVPQFERLKMEGYTKHLCEEATQEIDRLFLSEGKISEHRDMLYKFYRSHEERLQSSTSRGLREPSLDFSANVCVFYLKKNTSLLLFYSDNNDILKFWEGLDYIEEYHYQNQTDPPSDISSYAWNKRIENWDKVLKDEAPIKNGYNFTFNTERLPWFNTLDFTLIPNADTRVLNYLHDRYLTERISEMPVTDEHGRDSYFGKFSKAKDMWHKYKTTEEYTMKFAETKALLPALNFIPAKVEA